MTEHKLAKGRIDGRSELLYSLFFVVLAVFWLLDSSERESMVNLILSLAYIAIALRHLLSWRAFQKNKWSLHFDDHTLAILDSGEKIFEGSQLDLKKLDRNGDGYTLFLTGKKIFFLSHKLSNNKLSAFLDQGIDCESY